MVVSKCITTDKKLIEYYGQPRESSLFSAMDRIKIVRVKPELRALKNNLSPPLFFPSNINNLADLLRKP